jgi:hypothetical protein
MFGASLELGIWSLELFWSLVFGAWDFASAWDFSSFGAFTLLFPLLLPSTLH